MIYRDYTSFKQARAMNIRRRSKKKLIRTLRCPAKESSKHAILFEQTGATKIPYPPQKKEEQTLNPIQLNVHDQGSISEIWHDWNDVESVETIETERWNHLVGWISNVNEQIL
jgi:hypothetical protein